MTVAQHVHPPHRPVMPGHDGNDTDLAELVSEHQAMVWRYLRLLGADGHEADDLMQDSFVLVAERLRQGERLREPARYLRGVARNLLLGARRRARRRPIDVSWVDAVDDFVHAQPEALEDPRLDLLRACVARLQGRMRQAVELHHVEGRDCKQVADEMGLGANGLKSLLLRARRALRECVSNKAREELSS